MLMFAILACSETCPTPHARLDDVVWDVFLTPVEYTVDNPDAFPADSTPANGEHQLQIGWLSDQLFEQEVTVAIDGQSFTGQGTWSEVECGHFSLSWSGQYDGEDGASHGFAATASLTTYDHVLEGFVDWSETWKAASGDVGTYTAAVQLFGSKAGVATGS